MGLVRDTIEYDDAVVDLTEKLEKLLSRAKISEDPAALSMALAILSARRACKVAASRDEFIEMADGGWALAVKEQI